jgi:putative ABC transport system substrate-binding protein
MAINTARRKFIAALGGTAVAWPFTTRAQPSPVRPLIGLLTPLSASAASRNVAAFRSALRDLGYVEGRNLTLALLYGDGVAERIPSLAREMVALNPDVIFAGSNLPASAVHNATRTIPIVTITPENPITAGLAQSIARPGGNVTGTWSLGDEGVVGKELDLFRLAVSSLTRIGAMINPDDPGDTLLIPQLPTAAGAAGITVEIIEVRDLGNLDAVAARVLDANVQGLLVGFSPFWLSARLEMTALAARLKLPTVYGSREFVDVGGLMSYGPNLPELYRQSARLVDRILKGEKPDNLPFELPTRYELIVNLKAAKVIGLSMSNSFLLLADEVIE